MQRAATGGRAVDTAAARIADALDRIKAVVGAKGVVADPAAMEPYLVEERGQYSGAALLVVRPGTTAEVAEVVRRCSASGTPIYPQGGNTGLCGGAVPDAARPGIVLSLGRMNRVR